MGSIEENAIQSFREGLNCAQAVFAAWAEKLEYDRETAIRTATGFGGGIGRLQVTCGVVTGASMVIGMHNSRIYPDNAVRKEKSYEMIQEFHRQFVAEHHSSDCMDLINCDLRTSGGRELARERRLHETICEGCMATSMRILGEMIS
jgi:C_GCAxxG_C_C family probable redox protein